MTVDKTTLKNGIRIVSKTMPHARSVSMGVWVNVGARDEAEHADQRHQACDRTHPEPLGDHLGLRDEAEVPADSRGTRAEEIERQEAQGSVGQDVKGRGSLGVRPARTTEEGKGAEDRRPGDEVHHQQAKASIACDEALRRVGLLAPGPHAHHQRHHQVS